MAKTLGSAYEKRIAALRAKLEETESAHAKLYQQLLDKISYVHDLIGERDKARGEVEKLRADARRARSRRLRVSCPKCGTEIVVVK